MPRLLLLLAIACAAACTSNAQRIDRVAGDAQLSRRIVTGAQFQHVIYVSDVAADTAANAGRLLVFLDGDGRPWSEDGREPNTDPTTRNPIALQLLVKSQAPGVYISRPCYQEMVSAKCSPDVWTGGRYSAQVVASLAAVARDVSREKGATEIVMVGYSGGGALAVLVAERLANVTEVITIGANLDTDAWTQQHGYLPLATSLNPARSDQRHRWREVHFSGARDKVVPAATREAYFKKFPAAQQSVIEEFDHVCCWVEQWPALLQRAERAPSLPSPVGNEGG
jgi:pimeloyl-ACP methyl ester carboxylesterase